MRAAVLALATSVAGAAVLLSNPAISRACGCLSPPAVTEGTFAVNQQAEQIIFEVEPGWVTAHVLIKYAGDPEKFAWIVPVPEVPELAISPVSAFGIIDQATAPRVSVDVQNVCPVSAWACAYHNEPSCGGLFESVDDGAGNGAPFADAGTGGGSGVTVISEQVVGDYQTVTFRATEAGLATQWLRDNGFIVNQTTSIYMESYVQQNMVFVAAKLVPGAGIRAIKPLRMRYRSAYPMVPLILTAVAAEPHLTVTSFIYSNHLYRPMGHPIVSIDPARIAQDAKGRINYPMVLSRALDEAGGDGFALEYRGWPVYPQVNQGNPCCNPYYDQCGIGNDGQCQCPTSPFDEGDCAAQGDLGEGIQLVEELAQKYTSLTRVTTRVSAEEMTFDPTFEPDFDAVHSSTPLTVRGSQASLESCRGAVVDKEAFAQLDAQQTCATTYCGLGGRCVVTTSGAACACNTGFVAQRFTDLDGAPSVTCIPRTPPVDLRANGEQLPDACAGVSCGEGTCIDRNGVAVCQCAVNHAAALGTTVPRCEPIVIRTDSPGAQDYSEPLRDLDVCAPPPPVCGEGGWLIKRTSPRPGVDCGGTEPPVSATRPGPAPTCSGFAGCGCQETSEGSPVVLLFVGSLVGVVLLRRRRDVRHG